MAEDPLIEEGWVAAAVREEHPDLRLCSVVTPGSLKKKSPRGLKRRLADLSSRESGPRAIEMRSEPIPHAYRVFYRQIGLDPDNPETRTPIEHLATLRLLHGGFLSRDSITDSLVLGTVETGVPLWALDDDELVGPIGIREAEAHELLGEGPFANELPPGRLVVADDRGPVGVLFGETVEELRPTASTKNVRVFALQVRGVPEVHVEEALWVCANALDDY